MIHFHSFFLAYVRPFGYPSLMRSSRGLKLKDGQKSFLLHINTNEGPSLKITLHSSLPLELTQTTTSACTGGVLPGGWLPTDAVGDDVTAALGGCGGPGAPPAQRQGAGYSTILPVWIREELRASEGSGGGFDRAP